MENSLSIFCENEQALLKLGNDLAKIAPRDLLLFLQGELGAGKTTFVRGFLQGLGYQGSVKSPTYTLVESYALKTAQVHHFDLYRIKHLAELENIGFRDYFAGNAICLIEWPENAETLLPLADVYCKINVPPNLVGREVSLSPGTERGKKCIIGKLN